MSARRAGNNIDDDHESGTPHLRGGTQGRRVLSMGRDTRFEV